VGWGQRLKGSDRSKTDGGLWDQVRRRLLRRITPGGIISCKRVVGEEGEVSRNRGEVAYLRQECAGEQIREKKEGISETPSRPWNDWRLTMDHLDPGRRRKEKTGEKKIRRAVSQMRENRRRDYTLRLHSHQEREVV